MNKPLRFLLHSLLFLVIGFSFNSHAEDSVDALDIAGWATGDVKPVPLHSGRPWGWAVEDFLDEPKRPLYNTAKAKLLKGEQIFSHVISAFDIERYCAEAPHFDYTWFEMQHSTMRFDEVEKMMGACPHAGATPILRIPDASESSVQKAMDIGVLGIIVPTVEDAIMAREAARYARFPPTARRSAGGGQVWRLWTPKAPEGSSVREAANDNMLVIVMIETVEAVNNALEIAAVPGVDVVLIGNSDLSSFSGFAQNSPEYRDLQIKVRNATYRAGKLWGNAQFRNANGNPLSSESRIHMGGPSNDGWERPANATRQGY